jgi:homoserine kinase type II
VSTKETDNILAQELDSCAKVLARLHQAGSRFCSPAGTDRALPKIMDFLATFRQGYTECLCTAGTTPVDRFLLDNRDAIFAKVDQAIIADRDLTRMPQIPIHGDYHQGNLKYDGFRVIGVFDFDWSSWPGAAVLLQLLGRPASRQHES